MPFLYLKNKLAAAIIPFGAFWRTNPNFSTSLAFAAVAQQKVRSNYFTLARCAFSNNDLHTFMTPVLSFMNPKYSIFLIFVLRIWVKMDDFQHFFPS